MAFFRSKRSAPTPVPPVHHGSENPVVVQDHRQAAVVRSTVGTILGFMLVAGAFGYWLYGPVFRISSVTVSGTTLVQPQSVQAWVEDQLHQNHWLVIPGDQSAILSTTQLANDLHTAINKRLSVETVTMTKTNRHALAVHIIERQPLFIWQSGSAMATIDTNGIIIGQVDPAHAPNLAHVVDSTNLPITTDSSVVKSEVISSMVTIQGEAQKNGLQIDHFIIPHPQCSTDTNAGTNTNSGLSSGTNVNSSTANLTRNTNSGINANTPVLQNLNQGTQVPSIITCDTPEARAASQEVWIQLTSGPQVYFDRHENLATAVQTVAQLLLDPVNRTAQYIDARFESRVYIH